MYRQSIVLKRYRLRTRFINKWKLLSSLTNVNTYSGVNAECRVLPLHLNKCFASRIFPPSICMCWAPWHIHHFRIVLLLCETHLLKSGENGNILKAAFPIPIAELMEIP